MSRESRQRLRDAASGKQTQHLWFRVLRWFAGLIVLLLIAGGVSVWKFDAFHHSRQPVSQTAAGFKLPSTFAELCAVSTNDLEKCDIALMNLLCAEGLPGAEKLNVAECMASMDEMAKGVEFEIKRHYYKFREHPEEFNNSEGYYRMTMMATVLQQDYGIRYNPERISLPGESFQGVGKFFANSQDVFIHGLAHEGGMGTCSSMPVFYVAIGRRLGYPLKLVRAQGHLFARWGEGDKTFNIEGTSIGFVSHPDSFYRTWPSAFTPEEAESESYLKSLTPVQELTTFLSIRGHCCRAADYWLQAVGSYAQAFYKEPQSVGNQKLFAWAEKRAFEEGALPKRHALQFAIRSLEIPPGPIQVIFLARKSELNARNNRGDDEQSIERDLNLLRIEVSAAQALRSR